MTNLYKQSMKLTAYNQETVRGTIDIKPTPTIFSVQIDPDATEAVCSGDLLMVKVNNNNGKVPVAGEPANNQAGAVMAGFVVNQRLKNYYEAGELCEIATNESVMVMQAQTAFNAGSKVAYDCRTTTPANTGTVLANPAVATDGVIPCGWALDNATKAGDLVRIWIRFNN